MSVPHTLERWRNYMRECPSPSNWVDLGWYSAVAMALQRRVWYNELEHNPLFCNLYVVLIGPPGCGKGNVLRPLSKFFKHPQMRRNTADRSREPRAGEEIPLKVTLGPSDGSYQAIMDEMVANTRTFRYEQDGHKGAYIHCSIALILDELNSMFKRHSNEVPNFLLNTYDCVDHDYKTKNKGKNLLSRTCTNLLAGCTSNMLVEAARYGIFEDGFVSRCIFAFETQPKYYSFEFMSSYDEQQKQDYQALLDHLDRLTGVFGQIKFTPEALEFLRHKYETEDVPRIKSARARMQTYFSRIAAHTKKLAAAVHFSREFDMEVKLADAEEALRLRNSIEANMVAGFNAIGKNEQMPLYKEIARKVAQYPQGMGLAELLVEFQSDVNLVTLTEIMNTLVMTCEVRQQGDRYYGK